MSDLIVSQFVSLNGVVEANGAKENHPHGGWQLESEYGDDHYEFKERELREAEALLLGRKTYDAFAAAWPNFEGPLADHMNSIPKYVVSSTLREPEWNNTTVIRFGDIPTIKRKSGGPILVYGSARLTHALIEEDLVDEFRAMINPVLVAGGLRMFPDVEQMKFFRLTEGVAYESGVLLAIWRPA
jgi:dihydrofolate reductase